MFQNIVQNIFWGLVGSQYSSYKQGSRISNPCLRGGVSGMGWGSKNISFTRYLTEILTLVKGRIWRITFCSVTLLMTAIPFPYRGLDKEYNTEMACHRIPKPGINHTNPVIFHFSFRRNIDISQLSVSHLDKPSIPAWQYFMFKKAHFFNHSEVEWYDKVSDVVQFWV